MDIKPRNPWGQWNTDDVGLLLSKNRRVYFRLPYPEELTLTLSLPEKHQAIIGLRLFVGLFNFTAARIPLVFNQEVDPSELLASLKYLNELPEFEAKKLLTKSVVVFFPRQGLPRYHR